ncbi:MAG: glutathione S-transferase N-terminal domain-containing protein [Alphaproteobacteria bacterium]
MAIRLYDLAGAADLRFSPNCWRTRLALAHKGLECEAVATPFTAIPRIEDGRVKTVPAIRDGDRLVVDSWAIAEHLEATYPGRPSLFGDAGGRAHARFVQAWVQSAVNPILFRTIVADIHDRLLPEDKDYFRASRERRLGMTLEAAQAAAPAHVPALQAALEPLRQVVAVEPFLAGDRPLYADYVAVGSLLWARATSPRPILAADDPVRAWVERCLDLFDGLARRVQAAA